MKVLIGCVLTLGVFLLIPSVQKLMMPIFEATIVRLINMVSEKFTLRRLHLSLLGSMSFMTLIFAMIPRIDFTIGIICIIISSVMLWIVPRSKTAKKWMQEIFFGDFDILDESSVFAPIFTIFKWPLFALGVWVIIPWGVVLVDILGIVLLIFSVFKRLREAEQRKTENEMKQTISI